MLTYDLKKSPGLPLYEALYRCIREDILTGKLLPGQKLPSRRALCANLKVSQITVETAYSQLLSEGYICSREKVGYFVEAVQRHQPAPRSLPEPEEKSGPLVDLTANGSAGFPFSVWSRLQRQVMLDLGEKLLLPLPNQGILPLREAIARHLREFRGMQVNARDILIGAGTDFLYNLLIQLLGRDLTYAVEEPGYGKIRRIYLSAGASCEDAPMDDQGVTVSALEKARVLHISPAHHFPTGRVTPLQRRQELLRWAETRDGWIIEDDYDSEFRFYSHPLPTLKSLDTQGRVIYMNSFSKTLAPSIRMSFMVLPQGLMEKFRQQLGFYSCTVPSFEQYTLARFLEEGYFEKHINRMRKFYLARRDQVMDMIARSPQSDRLTILEEDAGLHFLVKVDTSLSDEQLVERWRQKGLLVQSLGSFYHGPVPIQHQKCLVINYSGLKDDDLDRLHTIITGGFL